jgi:hypothetical protein
MLVKELIATLSKRDPEAVVFIEVDHIYYDCVQVDPYEADSLGTTEAYIHATHGTGPEAGCTGQEDFEGKWYPG